MAAALVVQGQDGVARPIVLRPHLDPPRPDEPGAPLRRAEILRVALAQRGYSATAPYELKD